MEAIIIFFFFSNTKKKVMAASCHQFFCCNTTIEKGDGSKLPLQVLLSFDNGVRAK
jgi:hypothetical protein